MHVRVKPEPLQDFIAASRQNHQRLTGAPGSRRFDVLQSPSDLTQFVLYQAYVSAEAAAATRTHYIITPGYPRDVSRH